MGEKEEKTNHAEAVTTLPYINLGQGAILSIA